VEWSNLENRYTLHELKEIGHILLDEYSSMDPIRPGNKAKKYAYTKLGKKLDKEEYLAHFGRMYSKEAVVHAIATLRKMIKKRQKKLEFRYKDQYAPNLAELQKNIKKNTELSTLTPDS